MKLEKNKGEPEADLTPRRSLQESIQQLPFQVDVASGDFHQLAQQAYRSGDYHRAIMMLFSHVLVSLDQKGFVRLRKGKTNRQYLRELKGYTALPDYFGSVMIPFEAAFFGDHQLEKRDFEECWNGLPSFQNGLGQKVVTDA